jgi:pimeloyl-ACP methyl ester carboxylesterase
MPLIDVRDTRLFVERSGHGEVPVLILHGAGAGAWIWEEQMNRLTDQLTWIAYDRRGHSRSEPGERDQSLLTHVEDAAEMIRVLDLDRPILVGNSAGSNIAIELIHRYPELSRGAVLSEPGLFHLDPDVASEASILVGPLIRRANQGDDPRQIIESFLRKACPQMWDQIDEQTRDLFRDNAPVFLESLQVQRSTISNDDLSLIGHPVLVVSGSESVNVLKSIARIVAANLPNASLTGIENCGHVPQIEKPSEFAELIRTFAEELSVTESAGMEV